MHVKSQLSRFSGAVWGGGCVGIMKACAVAYMKRCEDDPASNCFQRERERKYVKLKSTLMRPLTSKSRNTFYIVSFHCYLLVSTYERLLANIASDNCFIIVEKS